jgi:DNA polymerase-3 subunit alpha
MKGAKKEGYTKQVAEKIWSYIDRFAGYGFNKAHSVSYAMIAYQTAYMKAHYPVEFMTALLTAESLGASGPTKSEKLSRAVEDARRMGIYIKPPDINESMTWFTIEKDAHSKDNKAIRFGLAAVKNVGEAAISSILTARKKEGKFASLTDFCSRVDNQKVNKKVLESLIQVGAFDKFGKRSAMLTGLDKIRQKAVKEQHRKDSGQGFLFDNPGNPGHSAAQDNLPDVDEFDKNDLLIMEKRLLGFYLSEHPWEKALERVKNEAKYQIFELDPEAHHGYEVKIGGVIDSVRRVFTKKGNNEMAFVNINDHTGNIDLVVFPNIFRNHKAIINEEAVIIVEGRLEHREERMSVIVRNVKEIEE